jgi:hypothetical protein
MRILQLRNSIYTLQFRRVGRVSFFLNEDIDSYFSMIQLQKNKERLK